jgi:hypothetical protein
MNGGRPTPLLGDVPLEAVQEVEHALEGGFVPLRIAGLGGELQQRLARPSHRIHLSGVLFREDAKDQIGKLQSAAAAGTELTFAADIVTALDLTKVAISAFWAREAAGAPGRYEYRITLVESPPLPPPAQVSAFGGLDDFGVGDLGFDTSLLGDLQNAAGAVADAVDQAMAMVDTLSALSNLDGLSLGGGLLAPVDQAVTGTRSLADTFKKASGGLASLFGS